MDEGNEKVLVMGSTGGRFCRRLLIKSVVVVLLLLHTSTTTCVTAIINWCCTIMAFDFGRVKLRLCLNMCWSWMDA